MSSSGFQGGDKRGGDDRSSEGRPPGISQISANQPALTQVLSQGSTISIPDTKMLQTIRPRAKPAGPAFGAAYGQSQNLMTRSTTLDSGSHGRVSAPISTTMHSVSAPLAGHPHTTIAMPITFPQSNIVHVNPPTSSIVGQQLNSPSIALNVNRSAGPQHTPAFPSHLPRGAIAAASALSLSKSNPNIASPATAVLRQNAPSIQIPSSLSALHGSTLQSSLARSPLLALNAHRAGTPPPARPTSPAVGLTSVQTQRSGFPASSSTNKQITLQTSRANIEIPKPVLAHSQTKSIHVPHPVPLPSQTKVMVSQTLTPHLHSAVSAKAVSISVASNPTATLNSVQATTTTATVTTIPVAKVPPLKQSSVPEVIRPEVSHPSSGSSIFISQSHRTVSTAATTPISMTTTIPAQDSRPNLPQLSPFLSHQEATPSVWQYGLSYPLIYPQGSLPMSSQGPVRPGVSTLIFPPRQQTDQTGHAMTMASASAVRFAGSPMMVSMDQLRQPLSVHPPFSQSITSTSMSSDSKPLVSLSSSNLCKTPPPAKTPPPGLSLHSMAAAASSMYTSPANLHAQQPAASPSSNPSASPRPSILRKRTSEAAGLVKRPLGLMPDSNHSPKSEAKTDLKPEPPSNISSPKTPAGDNSRSSTDTALSSNDATTPTQTNQLDGRLKQDTSDTVENGLSTLVLVAAASAHNTSGTEASPRKKPRKQLLNATEELKDNTSTDEEIDRLAELRNERAREIKKGIRTEYVDEDGVRWTTENTRPNINLMQFYNLTWKPRYNHFCRYSDVKPKDERRPTVNELSNQRGIQQKASGWKLYHMAAQLENLMDSEREMCSRISQLKEVITPRPQIKHNLIEDYDGVVHELSQANIQRCQLIGDQLQEARSSMLNILEHKPRIQEIINKHISKRPIKKKERT
ncbi:histone deacetylase complex subunit SAP130-A-like [Gigantopelta aegis]|uniref:histone deacetylase complex subunit SAP130-A-like n=1 Tax=Gigantopelta aegis TaxID=1735272 RepID=UPI001B88E57E|nr:histone deacetylase complex subunit SAP130-A-like [Gigantopelta aegis]